MYILVFVDFFICILLYFVVDVISVFVGVDVGEVEGVVGELDIIVFFVFYEEGVLEVFVCVFLLVGVCFKVCDGFLG